MSADLNLGGGDGGSMLKFDTNLALTYLLFNIFNRKLPKLIIRTIKSESNC